MFSLWCPFLTVKLISLKSIKREHLQFLSTQFIKSLFDGPLHVGVFPSHTKCSCVLFLIASSTCQCQYLKLAKEQDILSPSLAAPSLNCVNSSVNLELAGEWVRCSYCSQCPKSQSKNANKLKECAQCLLLRMICFSFVNCFTMTKL